MATVGDDKSHLALHLRVLELGRKVGEVAALHALVHLRKFDADSGLAVAQRLVGGLERRADAERALVADERVLLVGVLREPVAKRARPARREPPEGERAGGESAHDQRHVHRARARDHLERHILLRARAHKPIAGIGDGRIAAVRSEDDLAAGANRRHDDFRHALLVALPVADHLRARNAQVREQLPRAARVLARDQRCVAERLRRARAEIPQVSDRRGHHMQHQRLFLSLFIWMRARIPNPNLPVYFRRSLRAWAGSSVILAARLR